MAVKVGLSRSTWMFVSPLAQWLAAVLTVVLALAWPDRTAHAWAYGEGTLIDLSNDATQSLMIRQIMKDAHGRGRAGKATSSSGRSYKTLANGTDSAGMPRHFARRYPSEVRGEVERTFTEFLQAYQRLEEKFGIPRYDVAGAMAAFLAGSLMAYHQAEFPDRDFKPLVAQMRDLLFANADFMAAPPKARREMYEQLVIIGMSMATSQMALSQRPNPAIEANVRKAAGDYLRQFLQTDPDRVQITARGLEIR